MDVEAVVSVAINKLTNLLTEESKTFEKVSEEVEKVLAKLSNMHAKHFALCTTRGAKQQETAVSWRSLPRGGRDRIFRPCGNIFEKKKFCQEA
ncbi:hypothetical protein R6Q59_012291 [Mikania micrantha]